MLRLVTIKKYENFLENRAGFLSQAIRTVAIFKLNRITRDKIKQCLLVFGLMVLGPVSSFGQETLFFDDFETDQGWILTGEFERGTPAGGNGDHGNPNPTSAFSENNVIGTDLDEGYSNNLEDRDYIAESPTINCSGYVNITLNFQRWLNLEQSDWDHGYIDYYNGTTWINIWENPNTTLQETSWSLQNIELPAGANDNPHVKIRFALGSTDTGWNYSGWNIDDVEVTGTKTQVGYGGAMVFWLKGDLGVSGSTPISKWADQSGNGNDASPDSNGPDQVVSATMNNQQVLFFDGSSELNIENDPRINNGTGYTGNERTMCLAFKTGDEVSTPQYLYEQGGGTNGLGVFIKNNNVYVTLYNNKGSEQITVSESISANTAYVLSFNWNNGLLTARLNNTPFSTQSSNGTLTSLKSHSGSISIGFTDSGTRNEKGDSQVGGANFSGEIAEILYYDSSLSSEEEVTINTELAERYGIVLEENTHFYSYKSGNWSDPTTWTSDPGGTTQVGNSVPESGDQVFILSGRTVSVSSDVSESNLDVTINEGGAIDLGTKKFTNGLAALRGRGTLKIASAVFPTVAENPFVLSGGGTTEYYNSSDFPLPGSQSLYNNLVINATGKTATQMSDIELNGDLTIKAGTLRINDNSSTAIRSLTVNGNVTVNAGASITVGTGKTNTTNTPTGITGGTAPFIDYYTQFHTIILKGDFTNNGTVRLTNLDYPVYDEFPSASGKTGAATVYFQGAKNSTLTCNGTTDFYNLVLDKGLDQTYKLTVNSTAYSNFRLFGANISGGDHDGVTDNGNPNLKKALWIRTGTLELTGLTIIPSLTEGSKGGWPNSDYYIPVNGALVLNGPDVIVLSTADDYAEVNAAYGVSGGTGTVHGVGLDYKAVSFSVYGRFRIEDGYFSTRESGGIITWAYASGQLEMAGGYVDSKQIRAAGSSSGLASYHQTGGIVALRGRFRRTPGSYSSPEDLRAMEDGTINTNHGFFGIDGNQGTFSIKAEANTFTMSGGKVRIYDVCGTNGYAVDIFSAPNNINVTGGTFELYPTTGSNDFKIRSTAPFGNLVVKRADASTSVVRLDGGYALTVLKDLQLIKGVFNANDLDVTVGGDFMVDDESTYNSGANNTAFNGSADQLFTIDGTINNGAEGLHNLSVNKSAGILTLDGTQPSLTVQGTFDLTKGTLDDGGKNIFVAGNVTNSGVHAGDGAIELNGTAVQTVGGDGDGQFNNLTLNNNNSASAPISLIANTTINGVLTFTQAKNLFIDTYNLTLGAAASISGAAADRFIQTSGNAGDGGLSMGYNSNSAKSFPVGVENFTPATLGFSSAPDSYGTITVVPVNYEHPTTTTKDQSLTYFWRVKSNGFSGYEGKVTHNFVYDQSNVAGTESNYRPAVYDATNYTWSKGSTANVNAGTNVISDWNSPSISADILDGDYTAGTNSAFGTPEIFYSRKSGNWNESSTWSTSSHSGGAASRTPGTGDVVIIGDGHTVSLQRYKNSADRDKQNCASLQIEDGSVLDVSYNPGSDFGMVLSHPNGNGLIRVSTAYSSGSTFEFPNGDFTDFNTNLGTTELYTTNSTPGTTYWLPSDVTSYGNLIISPLGGSNIIFGNTDVTIFGDLTTQGQNSESWFCPVWDGSYPSSPTSRKAKTITIKGNFNLEGGALIFYGNRYLAQDFVIYGNLVVNEYTGIQVYRNAYNQSIEIGGDLINNASSGWGSNAYAGCDFTDIPVTFFGDTNASITNTAGTPSTTFEKVTVNKGTSQATKLTIDIAGDLETPNNDWLTLENGTLEYKRENPNSDFTITTNSPFTIPKTAGLLVDYDNGSNKDVLIANANSDNNDLYLNGKLTVANGDVYIGSTSNNRNNDIEYSGGGASAIEVTGGNLVVNGQIRRNPSSTSGILSYTQSGGAVTINGRNAITTNAKLEVLNSGSVFNMSGGTLNIVRGGGGNTYGDLYLRPGSSSVTGGDIVFAHNLWGDSQTYLLDANVPLNNLTITGRTGSGSADATVKLLLSPLTLKGNLTLTNANSIFDANSEFNVDLTIKGDLINNGTYNHYNNLTTFSGGEQTIKGTTATDFYHLKINPVTSVELTQSMNVLNDMELASGRLIGGTNYISLKGDLINNATYESDASSGGVILEDGDTQHVLSGTGTYGRLELNDSKGARLEDDITLQRNLILSTGVFDINDNLLTLMATSNIEGSGFNVHKMISSDGVYSNIGIRKYLPVTSSATVFTFPMGLSGKYTPAVLNITKNGQVGYVRVNTINEKHPSAKSPYRVLDYYWEVESSAISGFSGSFNMYYDEEDVMQAASDEDDYIAARLLVPGTGWSKASSSADNVDESNNLISFSFSGVNELSGEYTAGLEDDIPDEVPAYETNKSGDWTDASIWTPVGASPACPAGGPNGAVVIINHEVTANADNCFAYRTTINDKLNIVTPFIGHNLGAIDGQGTLYVESPVMPAGRYTDFLDCASNSTLEFGGSGDYNIVADLFTSVPNLKISGSGSRILPNLDLTICRSLVIDGATLDNRVNNRRLIIKGSMERNNGGVFYAGSGSEATVVFEGDVAQTIGGATGDFIGVNAFNNLEIRNSDGLTVLGQTEVSGDLILTNGLIHTTSTNPLVITNASSNAVSPSGGSSSSYVSGPLTKRINQSDSFVFPVGNEDGLGNKIELSATRNGTIDWTVEYFAPNTTYADFSTPLTYVNSKEYWKVSAPAGSEAIVNLRWDPSSDVTPLITVNGLADLRVASFNTSSSEWKEINSAAVGNNSSGTVSTSARVSVPVSGNLDFTAATVNTVKPKAKMTPTGAICGIAEGIPVTFTSSEPIAFNYVLNYAINGVSQTPVTVSALPFVLPTPEVGDYQLISFTYNGGMATGVVDESIVTVNATPTEAHAGSDQSLCGGTHTVLEANTPTIGEGVWSIVSGSGGTVVNPTMPNSEFKGTNGSGYKLHWTISNGECTSVDEVSVTFPVLAAQPGEFSDFDTEVCQGMENVFYSVPLDATVTYQWSYSGDGVTIDGTENSVLLSFSASATDGTLSVTATNDCNTSEARSLDITVKKSVPVVLTASTAVTSLCPYNDVTFTAVPGDGSFSNYEFFVDGISKQSGTSDSYSVHNLTNGQVVSLEATTIDGCVSVSDGITVVVNAVDGLWTGAVDSDWENGANWCSGSIPSISEEVEIPSIPAGGNFPEIRNDLKCPHLTINKDARVTLLPGVVLEVSDYLKNEGQFVLESTFSSLSSLMVPEDNKDAGEAHVLLSGLPAQSWHYLGHPIKDPAAGIYDVSNKVYKIEDRWTRLTDPGTQLNALEGIAFWSNEVANLDYSGTLNSGQQEFEFKWGKGYYIMSNPYPTAIDWKKTDGDGWERKNLSSTMWRLVYINASINYIFSYNGHTSTPQIIPTEYGYNEDNISHISPYECVWIKVEGAEKGTVKVDNKAQVRNTLSLKSSSMNVQSPDLIRFTARSEQLYDGGVLYFRDDFDPGFDLSDSEKKFNGSKLIPEIYTRIGTSAVAINGLPTLTEDSYRLPISVRNQVEGAVTLSVNLSHFNDVYSVFLEDTRTGIMTNLRETPDYEYTPAKLGDVHDRFVLLLKKVTTAIVDPAQVGTETTNGITITGHETYARVRIANTLLQQNQGEALVEVMDMNGRLLNQLKTNQSATEVDLPRNSGVYVVRAIVGTTVKSEKVVVQKQ